MASQVLSGASNPSYTNNTGENVRVVINYMKSYQDIESTGFGSRSLYKIVLNWAGLSTNRVLKQSAVQGGNPIYPFAIGKSVVEIQQIRTVEAYSQVFVGDLPNEILLAPGETFSAVCDVYNIVVIPENG